MRMPQAILQWLFQRMLAAEARKHRGVLALVGWKFLYATRTTLIRRFGDPLVAYQVNGRALQIPLSHQLPFIRSQVPDYSNNIGRIAALVRAKYPQLSMLDIGANVGDTVAIVRSFAHFPILCIDGDPAFLPILELNTQQESDVTVLPTYVGDADILFSGRIVGSGGSARLSQSEGSEGGIKMSTLSQILQQYAGFAATKLIKIDTDGFDTRILKSELPLLGRLKPVIFIEYDPYFFEKLGDDGLSLFPGLASLGYRYALVFENTGDYLLQADLREGDVLEDIHRYYSGQAGQRYCDICFLHADDADLAAEIRAQEWSRKSVGATAGTASGRGLR